jgi:hypothetical protein
MFAGVSGKVKIAKDENPEKALSAQLFSEPDGQP